MINHYKTCNRCVMTEKADSNISFDESGNCNYCKQALVEMNQVYFPNEIGEDKLKKMIYELKEKNKNKKYDCLMGISGGLDSCYLAYLGAVKWGLRIAAIHIDDGFDTEVSKENIRRLCKKCGIEMTVIHPNEKQFNELCRAYMLAGVPNLAVPQDNVLFSCIYDFAKQNDINDFLSGGNFALECILQTGNTHSAYDLRNIKDINRRFGRDRIDQLPLMSEWQRANDRRKLNVVEYRPLNYIRYEREIALKELHDFCDFIYYGSKHLENYYTGFLQLCWLPRKFGVDKRTSHLSSMIVTNQMTREQALEELKKAPCSEEWLFQAISMIKEKLDFSDEEFSLIMNNPVHQHEDYRTDWLLPLAVRVKCFVSGKYGRKNRK